MTALAIVGALCVVLVWLWLDRRHAEPAILRALAEGHAFGLVIRRRASDAGAPLSGAMYAHLRSMEDGGLLRSWEEPDTIGVPGGLPRRMYALTDAGRARLTRLP